MNSTFFVGGKIHHIRILAYKGLVINTNYGKNPPFVKKKNAPFESKLSLPKLLVLVVCGVIWKNLSLQIGNTRKGIKSLPEKNELYKKMNYI